MEELIHKTPVKLENVIIEVTAKHFGLTADELKKSKATDTVSAYQRHVCYYLLRINTMLSFDKIAIPFTTGKSTIQFGFEKIEGFLSVRNRRIVGDVDHLQNLINNFIKKSKEQSLAE